MATYRRQQPRGSYFIESMECLPVATLPEGPGWTYEIKLDGFRLEAVKEGNGTTTLYSRRKTQLNRQFPYIADALSSLPQSTVLDGELVAIDPDGRSNFSLLQSFRSAESQIHYYVFDILRHKGKQLLDLSLEGRRAILERVVTRNEHIGISAVEYGSAASILSFVTGHGLEGVVAKRSDSVYEAGKRSGAWSKYRINLGQEFVIGGYTPGTNGFDALIVGFYRGDDLIYCARVRAGFVPATRREVFDHIKNRRTSHCPFVNLPETGDGRWGQGLTAEKMKECVWLKPQTVVRIDFREWTGADHLRHARFVGLRDDKDARQVVREDTR